MHLVDLCNFWMSGRGNTVTHSNTVFINECDKRTNSKEKNKERNRSNGKLKKFK